MMAVSDGLYHVLWLRNLLIAQGYKLDESNTFQDNQTAILLLKTGNSQSSTRTRHMAMRFYIVNDRADKGEIKVEYLLSTENMVEDIFAKPLQGKIQVLLGLS